jgi:hypothetical protein
MSAKCILSRSRRFHYQVSVEQFLGGSGDFAAISKFHPCMEPPKFFIIFNTHRMLQILVEI